MTDKLMAFLTRNRACHEGLDRLAATGAKTPDEAWARADARDLVWAVTRPGVMSDDQRRRFLAVAVLAPVEHLFIDERSKNILQKLRTNEQITDADELSAADAADAAWAAHAARAAYAAYAAADAAFADAYAATDAYAAADAAYAATDANAAARNAQARWIRENIKLSDLHIN